MFGEYFSPCARAPGSRVGRNLGWDSSSAREPVAGVAWAEVLKQLGSRRPGSLTRDSAAPGVGRTGRGPHTITHSWPPTRPSEGQGLRVQPDRTRPPKTHAACRKDPAPATPDRPKNPSSREGGPTATSFRAARRPGTPG